MRIVHLGTHDIVGGAARALHRLHLALRAEGADSRLLVRTRSSSDPATSTPVLSRAPIARAKRWLRRQRMERQARAIAAVRPADQDGFHGDRGLLGAELAAELRDADVVHLHWTQGYLDLPELLPVLARLKPVVWTLHDLHGLTGGCHYPKGCEQWLRGCERCPQFTLRPDSPLAGEIWTRMNRTVAAVPPDRLHMVTASRWMAGLVEASPRFRERPVACIPYGLDTTIFTPRDRRFSRELLDLPVGAKIILFVSDTTRNPRKGLDVLARAAALLKDGHPDLLLVSLGQGQAREIAGLNLPHRHLGAVSDDRWLSLAYSAADVFVIPSLEEAYGQTMLESLACGTVAVGSDTGGIPDLIKPGENGLLFAPGDHAALARALDSLLTDPAGASDMGRRGRTLVEEKHSPSAYADAHLALYRSAVQ